MPPERVISIRRAGGEPRVEADRWRFVGLEAAEEAEAAAPEGPIVVPAARWLARAGDFAARRDAVGVWLDPADDPAALAPWLAALPLVAVRFPRFTDGRGYSSAVLLRTRLGYRGELRAFGDVGRDQLFYLKRCGFDSFALAAHRDPHAALASLAPFSIRYQASVDDPLPLFRRRGAELAP